MLNSTYIIDHTGLVLGRQTSPKYLEILSRTFSSTVLEIPKSFTKMVLFYRSTEILPFEVANFSGADIGKVLGKPEVASDAWVSAWVSAANILNLVTTDYGGCILKGKASLPPNLCVWVDLSFSHRGRNAMPILLHAHLTPSVTPPRRSVNDRISGWGSLHLRSPQHPHLRRHRGDLRGRKALDDTPEGMETKLCHALPE